MRSLRKKITVPLRHTDAAGLLFFTNQLVYAHEVFEMFMVEIGFSLNQIITVEPFLVPIVHAESDYSSKLAVGDQLEAALESLEIGNTSFTLNYSLTGDRGQTIGRAQTVHVAIDKKSHEKIPLPDEFRQALQEFGDAD